MFKMWFKEWWCIIFAIGSVIALFSWGIWTTRDNSQKREAAEKLCYPYVILVQTDEMVVCAGVEEPVVKKRK